MVRRPSDIGAFEFAVVSAQRSAQLRRGCTPRVERREKVTVTAQQEVAERMVSAVQPAADGVSPSTH